MTRDARSAVARPVDQWPAATVQLKSLAELVPYAHNSRTHTPEQIEQIAASMREWGWTNPVLVDEEGTIIAGHGRIEAARVLGLKEVPVMTARGWTDAQKRAYVIADNQLALNAGWDPDTLKMELGSLSEDGFRLELTGFSGAELAMHMFEPDFAPVGAEEQTRLDRKKAVVCPACNHEFVP